MRQEGSEQVSTRATNKGSRSEADARLGEKQTITDKVYEAIRRDLMECRWPAGQTLKIRSLAAEFGVSPMPVRMALKRLGEEGALLVEEQRSARVPTLSAERYSEFHEIAVMLEARALTRACARISQKQIDALIARADQYQADLNAGHVTGYAQRFNSILMEIYRLGGSTALVQMIEHVWVNVAPPANAIFEIPLFATRIHAHLKEVLQAVKKGDKKAAESALVAALRYSERAMSLLMDIDELAEPARMNGSE
ncbi:GntR family transcriptional regulator [Pseudotabrizicola sp. 4114]|uniref:GntR family transcriptional regulator n=1 Tax=Pseudotabrizicola sp. 4114 TaxID=2817731 RepID=UPI002861F3E8|nr:DNA-binding GntR family transcriptional regulator [Pseudorhodobacter sp. 4114]